MIEWAGAGWVVLGITVALLVLVPLGIRARERERRP